MDSINKIKDGHGRTVASPSKPKFDIHQWPEPSDIHPFVSQFSDKEDLFANHEIEYLKNNCEHYPKDFYDSDKFQEIMDEIDLDEIREKTKDKLDKYDDWTNDSIKTKNPFRKEWQKLYGSDVDPGMYEKEDKIGMFGREEEIERLLKYLDDDDE